MKITLAHGNGGKEMKDILRKIKNIVNGTDKFYGMNAMDDACAMKIGENYIVFSTDSYTVKPIFFPNADIGKLSICGSINDVCVMGAEPKTILLSIIVEEGFDVEKLERIVMSTRNVCRENCVEIVGGDFKVMPKGSIDEIVINTTCIGITKKLLTVDSIRKGDKIIVTSDIGRHGALIFALQNNDNVDFESDVSSLKKLCEIVMKNGRVKKMRDLTRGGLASALNDIARLGFNVVVDEKKIPVNENVRNYTEMMGIDFLNLACEGCMIVICESKDAQNILDAIIDAGYKNASIIGEIRSGDGFVLMKTSVGHRIIEEPIGNIVPRIC